MSAGVSIRALSNIGEAREAAALIDHVWGEHRIVTPALLLAVSTHGGEVLLAYEGETIVGAQLAFLGLVGGELTLHSHITGIDPGAQQKGIGFELKKAQRQWCLERSVDIVTWTFDPMIARNAHFNLRKLGAMGVAFRRDLYGPMEDAINAGERTDRIEIRWELRSERVDRALRGGSGEATRSTSRVMVRIAEDYLAMRASEPDRAREERDRVADQLEEAMAGGLVAVDFDAGAYVLEPR
ncbi:MAG TPA: GNAT family N-acetyltransferase [Actinomycetota bacterium]|nr:GNAT family N-acetyltransferase [Actinomycetota bacterium]